MMTCQDLYDELIESIEAQMASNIDISKLIPFKTIDRIPISPKLLTFPVSEAFLMTGKGSQMEPDIKSGAQLICQYSTVANPGDIVVAKSGPAAQCKFYRKTRGVEFLQNGEGDIFAGEFEIFGIVKQIINPT